MNKGWPDGTGNGMNDATNLGRIRLAGSRGNSSQNLVLYAQVHDLDTDGALGTWVTTDQGENWLKLEGSNQKNYEVAHEQDWFDLFISADPVNDRIYTSDECYCTGHKSIRTTPR
jgi:hypothetical protein